SRVSKVEHDGRPEPLWRPFDGHIVKGRGLHLGTGHMSRWIEAVANERSGEPRGRIEADRVDLDRGAQEPARVEAEDQLVEKVDEERLAVLGLEIDWLALSLERRLAFVEIEVEIEERMRRVAKK